MKPVGTRFAAHLSILSLFLFCFSLFPAGAALAQEGTKRALLIGINKYQELPWLSGSKNDVAVMRELLIRRYGFSESNIRTLLDEQATRSAILDAMENLVKQLSKTQNNAEFLMSVKNVE